MPQLTGALIALGDMDEGLRRSSSSPSIDTVPVGPLPSMVLSWTLKALLTQSNGSITTRPSTCFDKAIKYAEKVMHVAGDPCPQCHDHATTLLENTDGAYCPNCGWPRATSVEQPERVSVDGKRTLPEELIMADGKYLSSKIPPYHLIPTVAMKRLAIRFEYGEQRKGKAAWNAASDNQEVLLDKEVLLHRLGHVIGHAYKLLDKVINNQPFEDDDAAAIAWGGIFAICCTDAIEKQRQSSLETHQLCGHCHKEITGTYALVVGSQRNPFHHECARKVISHEKQATPPSGDH